MCQVSLPGGAALPTSFSAGGLGTLGVAEEEHVWSSEKNVPPNLSSESPAHARLALRGTDVFSAHTHVNISGSARDDFLLFLMVCECFTRNILAAIQRFFLTRSDIHFCALTNHSALTLAGTIALDSKTKLIKCE